MTNTPITREKKPIPGVFVIARDASIEIPEQMNVDGRPTQSDLMMMELVKP